MYDHTLEDGPKDAPKVLTLSKYGHEVRILRGDPYGFLYLEADKELPLEFKGHYTGFELAEIDANRYLESLKDNNKKK